jgi:hypothetical protein
MPVSKRQEKIEARRSEQQAFLKARERYNMAVFMQAQELGKQLFEAGKDKLTEGQIAMIEAEMADNQKMIDEYLDREGLRAKPEQEAPGLPDTEASS